MRLSPLWLRLGTRESAALLACWLVASGCAPSHRLVHEGDRYFERCYGADFDAKVGVSQKEACWQAWITYYTKHQPAHRVDYALGRIESLQNGDPPPALPGLGTSGEAPGAADAGPADGADAREPGAQGLATMAPDAGPVPNGCLHFCNEYESRCNARCDHGSLACSANCEHERSVCLQGCY
jgi:hypothetical protein